MMNMGKGCDKLFVLVIALAITIAFPLALFPPVVKQEAVQLPTGFSYAYVLSLADVGITPSHAVGISPSSVLVAGKISDVNAVVLLDVSNPYENPRALQVYPLTGSPTCMDVDGYPITRVAVGTDKGEVLVLKVDGGEIVGYVHRVFGADFYVNQVFVAKSPDGKNKVIALVSEGGPKPKTALCTQCYVYAFDEESPGLFRAGPVTGNATLAMDDVIVQMVAPLKMFTEKRVYYNASSVFLAFIRRGEYVELVINISYIEKEQVKRAAGAAIMVTAYSKKLGIIYVYGVNADSNGVARVPIPVIDSTILSANISIYSVYGSEVWRYSFLPERSTIRGGRVYPTLAITLPEPPVTDDATKLYGPPPFTQFRLAVLDLSKVPTTYSVVAELQERLPAETKQMSFVSGGGRAVAVLQIGGNATLATVSASGKRLYLSSKTVDYVGLDAELVSVATYPGTGYVIAGFNSGGAGKVRVFNVSKKFELTYIYHFDTPVKSVHSVIGRQGYAHIAVLSHGAQLLLSTDRAVPLFRNNTELIATVPGYVDGWVLPDLSTAFLVSPSSVTVVKNLNTLIYSRQPVALDAITAPTVKLKILLPEGEALDKVYAIFRYPPDGLKMIKPDKDGFIVLKNIVPYVSYSIYIGYEKPYIKPTELPIFIQEFKDVVIPVALEYKVFTVKLNVVDPISKTPVAPYIVLVDGRVEAKPTRDTTLSLSIVYGMHNITIAPAPGAEYVYTPTTISACINQDMALNVTLVRKVYNLHLEFIDSLTNSTPIAPLLLSITNALAYNSTVAPGVRIVNALVFYGNTTITVKPSPGFESVYTTHTQTIFITNSTAIKVRLERVKYTIALLLSDSFGTPLLSPLDVFINGSAHAAQVKEPRLELRLPYGLWVVSIRPSKGFENVYEQYTATLVVDRSLELEIPLSRVRHTLSLNLLDDYGTLIAPVVVNVVGVERGAFVAQPPMRTVVLSLPYGNYTVSVNPVSGYERVYSSTSLNISLVQPLATAVRIPRQRYSISIAIRDEPFNRLIGAFDLLVNGSRHATNFRGGSIVLPYGTYTLQLTPIGDYARMYEASKPVTLHLTNNTNLVIPVSRRMYSFTIFIREGATPIKDAVVTITNLETGTTFTTLISGEEGSISTKMPFASYEVAIAHPNYHGVSITYVIDGDKIDVVYLSPTLTTVLWRYAPLIITLVVIGIAIYAGFKIRAIIAKRLVVEEEVF
jgi:hypothetical protein